MNADASPFTQLLAIAIASFSCLVILFIFFRDKPWLLLFFSPFCLSPYTLQCFSYKFDAPWFALSILTSCAPFFFILQDNKKIQLSSTIIFILLTLNLYQSSIGIFLIIFFYSILFYIRGQKQHFYTPKKYFICLLGFAIAIIIYYLQTKFVTPVTTEWGNAHAKMIFYENNPFEILIINMQNYIKYIFLDWDKSIFEYTFIINSYIIILFSFIMIFKSSDSIHIIIKIIIFICIVIFLLFSPYSLQLFLTSPVWHARTFIALGCLISFIMIDAITLLPHKSLYKKIIIGLNIYCIFQFITIGNIYGNLLVSQSTFENTIIPSLTTDLSTLKNQQICQNVSFRNSISYSPAFENIGRKYPVIYKLIYPRIGNNAHIQDFLKYYGTSIPYTASEYFDESNVVREHPTYKISVIPEKTCVIYFK